MKPDVLIPLAYLSYYRHQFFAVDLVVFLSIFYIFYHITQYETSPVKDFIMTTLFLQLVLSTIMFFWIFSMKPIMVHLKTKTMSGYVFVLMIIMRIINIMLVLGFLIMFWSSLKEGYKKWLVVLSVLLIYYTYSLFYLLFPSLNKALTIYEMFYNIRNLFITNDPDKKQKTMAYLRQMKHVPEKFHDLFRHQWQRTFKNKPVPLI